MIRARAIVAPLQQYPERLHAVDIGFSVHILFDGVLHGAIALVLSVS